MDEAETLCDRIAVFKTGKVVAVDTPAGLVGQFANNSTVEFTYDGEDLPWLRECPGVTGVEREGPRYAIRGEGPLLAHVASALVAHGIAPLDLRVARATLEQAFLGINDEGPLE
jgi:ABC-2 type transport system ATP-binding protein